MPGVNSGFGIERRKVAAALKTFQSFVLEFHFGKAVRKAEIDDAGGNGVVVEQYEVRPVGSPPGGHRVEEVLDADTQREAFFQEILGSSGVGREGPRGGALQGSARSRVTEPELETGAGAGYVETVAPPQGEVVGRTDIIVPVGDVLLIVVIIHVQGRAPPFDRTVGSVEVQPHRVLRADVDGRSVEGPCFGFVGIHGFSRWVTRCMVLVELRKKYERLKKPLLPIEREYFSSMELVNEGSRYGLPMVTYSGSVKRGVGLRFRLLGRATRRE